MPVLMAARNLALAGAILAVFLAGAWINGARWEARHSAYVAEIERAHALAQAQARSEEQRRQTAVEGIRRHAQDEIAQALADAAAADAAAERLRQRVTALARTAASYTGIAERGPATADPVLLLAELFIEMERAGRALAAEADARGVAGRACEAAHDSLSVRSGIAD